MSDLNAILDAFADRVADKVADKMGARSGDPLLSVAEAAKRLGVSPSKFHRLVNAGAFKPVKGFKSIRVKQSAVDAYGK